MQTVIASRTKTLATTALLDADGHKTTILTSMEEVVYDESDLNGADALTGAVHGLAYYPTAFANSTAGAFTVGTQIVWTGRYRGRSVTRTSNAILSTNGNQTVIADGPLEGPPETITVPAQVDDDGAWTFGWRDVVPKSRTGAVIPDGSEAQWPLERWVKVMAATAGNVHLGYRGGVEDTVGLIAGGLIDAHHIERLYSDTAVQVTLFIE